MIIDLILYRENSMTEVKLFNSSSKRRAAIWRTKKKKKAAAKSKLL